MYHPAVSGTAPVDLQAGARHPLLQLLHLAPQQGLHLPLLRQLPLQLLDLLLQALLLCSMLLRLLLRGRLQFCHPLLHLLQLLAGYAGRGCCICLRLLQPLLLLCQVQGMLLLLGLELCLQRFLGCCGLGQLRGTWWWSGWSKLQLECTTQCMYTAAGCGGGRMRKAILLALNTTGLQVASLEQ
jgi:hypothetical protein